MQRQEGGNGARPGATGGEVTGGERRTGSGKGPHMHLCPRCRSGRVGRTHTSWNGCGGMGDLPGAFRCQPSQKSWQPCNHVRQFLSFRVSAHVLLVRLVTASIFIFLHPMSHLRTVKSDGAQIAWMREHVLCTVPDVHRWLLAPSSVPLLPLYVATKTEAPALVLLRPQRPVSVDAKRPKLAPPPAKVYPSQPICTDRTGCATSCRSPPSRTSMRSVSD